MHAVFGIGHMLIPCHDHPVQHSSDSLYYADHQKHPYNFEIKILIALKHTRINQTFNFAQKHIFIASHAHNSKTLGKNKSKITCTNKG